MDLVVDLSDEKLLSQPLAQKWKEEAREYWEKWNPKYVARLKKERKFEQALNRAVLNALRTYLDVWFDLRARPEVQNEPDFLERAKLIETARLMAEEQAKQMWLWLPPEPEALKRDEEN